MVVPAAESLVPYSGRSTILYVEDEVLVRLATADELRAEGFTVIEAGTATEAMAVVQSSVRLDLLITDIRLPGTMDGVALAGLARKARPALKIIVASAYVPDWPAATYIDAFLGKPCDVARVVRRIRELLAGGEQ